MARNGVIAQEILAGQFQPGDTVTVDARDGKLTFGTVVEAELVD